MHCQVKRACPNRRAWRSSGGVQDCPLGLPRHGDQRGILVNLVVRGLHAPQARQVTDRPSA